MNDVDSNQSTWEPFVGNGALGGLVGEVIFGAIAVVYVGLQSNFSSLISASVLVAVVTPILGLINGAIVGYCVFSLRKRFNVARPFVRVLIGAGVLLTWYLPKEVILGSHHFVYSIGSAVLVGGLAGFWAKRSSTTDSSALNADPVATKF